MRRDVTWSYPTRFTLEMSRAAFRGGTLTLILLDGIGVSTRPKRRPLPRCFNWKSRHYWGKHYPDSADSCAGDSPYCSFVTLKYDISCGGRLSSQMVER